MKDNRTTRHKVEAGLPRRRRKEFLFKTLGMLATTVGIAFLGVFFASLISEGSSAFKQTYLQLDIELSEDVLAPDGDLDLAYADFDGLIRAGLREKFPQVSGRSERRELYRLASVGAAYQMRDMVEADPELLGTSQSIWVPASSTVDMLIKGNREIIVNREKQNIFLVGLVRPEDVSAQNVILSTAIADAKISITGKGVISDKQQPGYGSRIYEWIWPFK